MLNENQLNEIKEKLEYGEEVVITCATVTRTEEVRKQLINVPGKLKVKIIGAKY